jgi:methylated-DNA-[protein]-cysteine S-methyltransferase
VKQHTVALARTRSIRSEERPYCAVVATPFAQVGFRTHNERIVGVQYLPRHVLSIAPATALAREACAQLEAYIRDPRRGFELPCAPEGTAFQRAVWNAIATIPNAATRTYGELAHDLGSSARAVGNACGSNPIPLIVPCHRVVAASGRLGGFMHSRSDFPLSIKRWLLAHEAR